MTARDDHVIAAMTMFRAPVPLAVLTGFLGAGKTTLLNRLLRASEFAGTAVIVNEFGDVGIDHLLVEAVDGDRLVLTTGCVCCAARGDLLAAIDGLMERRGSGALDFDRIVIETTGIADPGPILNAMLLGPALAGAVRIEGVLTLVSVVEGDSILDRHEEARRQVAMADRILLTKTDIASSGDALRLTARLSALNPTAPVGIARDTSAPLAFGAPAVSRPIVPVEVHLHHHAADARIRAVAVETGLVDADRLGAFVAAAQARYGSALLRLKGIAALRHEPNRPAVVQAVGHLLHPATFLDRWPHPDRTTRLVVVVDGVDPAEVTVLWDAFFGPPTIDRPDAASLIGEVGAGLFA